MKLLLWVVVALVVAIWLIHSKKKQVKASRRESAAPPAENPETMVRCAYCGTYVPLSEAVSRPEGVTFCSEDHRLRHSSPDSPA